MFDFFFFQAEDGIRDIGVTGVQTCALPIFAHPENRAPARHDPAHRRHEDHRDNLPARSYGWYDHRRGRPSRGGAAADSGALHAPWQRLYRRDPGRLALVPLLLYARPPATVGAAR